MAGAVNSTLMLMWDPVSAIFWFSGGGRYELNNHPSEYASLTAQKVKNLPAVQETWVQSLG